MHVFFISFTLMQIPDIFYPQHVVDAMCIQSVKMHCLKFLQPGAPKLPPSRYIVDLIHEPGKLLPIYSHEAVAYQKV